MDVQGVPLQEIVSGQSARHHFEPENGDINRRLRNLEGEQSEPSSLPPVDRGRDAYLFLTGCFFIEALVWGLPFTFGVFQDYYSSHEPFNGSNNIAAIGTTALGIMYLGCPFIFTMLQRFPRIRRIASGIGLLIMSISLAVGSFSTKTSHLILTQGVFYGIGGSLAYAPTILFLDEWFVARKGMAFGIMWTGTGISGIIQPIIMQSGLTRYSFRTMFRAYALTLFLLTVPLLYYVKPRIPPALSSHSRRLSFAFLRNPTFLILQAGNIAEGLGFFLPTIYLPSYAHALGLSPLAGTLSVALFNTMSVVGCLAMGVLTDRWHVTSCILLSTVGAALSVFLLWGLAVSLPLLCCFALTYGLFAGSFTTTWPGVLKEVKARETRADTGLVFSLLAAGRGIGSVVSGPLSEALLKGSEKKSVQGFYSENYRGLMIFTGMTAALGGVGWVGRRIGWL